MANAKPNARVDIAELCECVVVAFVCLVVIVAAVTVVDVAVVAAKFIFEISHATWHADSEQLSWRSNGRTRPAKGTNVFLITRPAISTVRPA